jgi:hypothetical protein
METEGVDVCEAVQRLLPANIIASEAMDRLAQRERWAPFNEEAEIVAFRIFVNSLLDAAQRGVLTTLTQTQCARLARNNMVWMGRAGRHASSWEEVEAKGISYEELASPETTAMLESLNQEATGGEAPIDGAGPLRSTPREEGPSQGAAARVQRGEPRQPPVTSRAVQTESAAEEGTFLLEPVLQDAMAQAVFDLVGGLEVELPWLNLVSLADELLDQLYERLEEEREGIMTRPLRIVGPEQEVTGGNTGIDGTPQQPPPPAGPGGGPQPAPREEDGPPGGAQPPEVQGEPPAAEGPPAVPEGPPAGQQAPPGEGDQPAGPGGLPAQSTGPTDGPPATSAMYVGTPEEYLAGAADVAPLFKMAEPGARAMLAQGLSATRAKGHQLDERVKAPIFDTTKGGVWVNGKPITGVAILDTGAMPLLVGRAGMEQMG